MALRKILVLVFSLIPIFSAASRENEKLSLLSDTRQLVVKEQFVIEPQLSPRSASKKVFNIHQEISSDSKIVINLEDLPYDKFISLMRLLNGLSINHEIPSSLTESYKHVKPLYQPSRDEYRTEFNVLNLAGGGTRGFLQAYILAYIEEKTGKKIHELFDLVIGTSTGCFTVAGACFDKCESETSNNESAQTTSVTPYTAEEITKLYTEESKVIFGSYYYSSMKGIRGTQYDSVPLEKMTQKYFGKLRLADAKIPVIFMAQDLKTAKPFFYCSETLKQKVKYEEEDNKLLSSIVREVTSAPNYFDPVPTQDGKTISDGGITNNNPILFALSEGARIFNVGLNRLNIFSLETGFVKPDPETSYKNLGAISWLEIISTNIFNGESQHFTAEKLIKAFEQQDLLLGKGEYLRIQFDLPLELYHLSESKPQFFEGLKKVADTYIEQNKKQLDTYIEKLLQAKSFL